jgi:hypothetical protein
MRKLLVITLVGALLFSAIPGVALAGGHHSGSDVAAGLVLGATAAVVGGVLLNAFAPPVAYAPPPVVYAPAPPVVYAPAPPVVYAPTPPVVYSAPPVVYAPAPVVIHRDWAPRYHGKQGNYRHERGWYRH